MRFKTQSVSPMSTIHLHQTTTLTPSQYISGLTDFGPGRSHENWPTWYAEYMVREQTGQELPQ